MTSAPLELQQKRENNKRRKRQKKGGDENGDANGEKQQETGANGEPAKKRQKKGGDAQLANTAVYFSGLPLDATDEEVAEFFAKCGVLKEDPNTLKPKVKLYRDADNQLKVSEFCIFFFRGLFFFSFSFFFWLNSSS